MLTDPVQMPHGYPTSSNKSKSTAPPKGTPSHTPNPSTTRSSKTETSSRVKESRSNHHLTNPGEAHGSHIPLSNGVSTSPKAIVAKYYNPFSDIPINLPPPTHKSSRVQSSGMPVYLPSPSNVAFEGIHHGPYFVTPPLNLPKEEFRDEDVPASAAINIDEAIRKDTYKTDKASGHHPIDEDSVAHLRPESKRRRRVRAGLSLQSDLASHNL